MAACCHFEFADILNFHICSEICVKSLLWQTSTICNFKILYLLTADGVRRPVLHQHAKFREDRLNRCWDIAIFLIFKMAATAIFGFPKFDILTVEPLYRQMCVPMPNFVKISKTVAEIFLFKHQRHWAQAMYMPAKSSTMNIYMLKNDTRWNNTIKR